MYRNRYGRAGTAGTAADRLPNWALPVALLVNTPTPVMFDYLGHLMGTVSPWGRGEKVTCPSPRWVVHWPRLVPPWAPHTKELLPKVWLLLHTVAAWLRGAAGRCTAATSCWGRLQRKLLLLLLLLPERYDWGFLPECDG